MNNYKEQILYVKENSLQADNKITNEWSKLQTFNLKPKATKDIAPLLTINWAQGQYYNTSCPYDASSSYDNHAVVGCVAVAMGQVMKYHSYPAQGVGSHSYTHSTYGNLSADFGATTYNWANMPDDAST